jgi:uncharacterized membrane protein YdfJ with MMPL/SSD domain
MSTLSRGGGMSPEAGPLLSSLARLVDRRPRRVVVIALVLAVTAGSVGVPAAGSLKPFSSDDPDSESVAARRQLAEATGVDPYFGVIALVRTGQPVGAPATRARVELVARTLGRDPAVASVRTFYRTGDRGLVALDRRSTYVVAGLEPLSIERQLDAARRLEQRLSDISSVKLGGLASFYARGNDTATEDLIRAELFAFPVLLAIALWVFRGIVAALLPLLVGGVTISGAFIGLRIASEWMDVSIYALNIVTALGLGLAVDYSLLMLSRWREEKALGGPEGRALRTTLATAGQTVLFSSVTVAGAASSLLVFPQPFLRSIGVGGMLVALIAGAVALTVLPAALVLLGDRVDSLSPRRPRRAAAATAHPAGTGGWYRLSRFVMRRAPAVAAITSLLLVCLGIPFLGIRLTQVDVSVVPKSSSDRQVREAIDRDFPRNRAAPIILAVEAPADRLARRRLKELAARLGGLEGAAAATDPRPVSSGLWRIDVFPRAAPLSDQSQDLVREIRSLPTPYRLLAGGESASLVDLKEGLGRHLPAALLILLAVTLVAVFLMTGSAVLPVKAVLMNVLTLIAASGVMVLVFQDGALEGLLGYTSSGALEASSLVLILAVAFGLATDYGIFLLSRIKEARDSGVSDQEAIALGLERTGRVVTAAALLLCVAIGSLLTARHALVKEVGFGTALAVAIDATIVRALLVPSLMKLLGHFNWWAPAPLERLHGRLVPRGRGTSGSPGNGRPPATNVTDFLEATGYCDFDHPSIRATLAEVLDGSESPKGAAIKLFRFVRDDVLYAFGPWKASASRTLASHAGTCTNKSNLLIALLRGAGIPAAYGVLRVNAREYFGNLGPDFLTRYASTESTHIYAAAHLDGRWVKCDPSTDSELAQKTAHFCRQTRLIEWDGEHDSLDFLDPRHIHADLGLRATADDLLAKPPRNARPEVLEMGNDYLRFIRTRPPFPTAEALIGAYRAELRRRQGVRPSELSR